MPLIKTIKKNSSLKIAVWHFDENPQELFLKHPLSLKNRKTYESRSPKRQREFLATYSAFCALGRCPDIFYDGKGKPFLAEGPYISLSHSSKRGAVALSEQVIGIDIQREATEKILGVSEKFVHPLEASFIRKSQLKDYLHIIWGIKESLYKINGGSLRNVLENYRVMPFSLEDEFVHCCIKDDNKIIEHKAFHIKINNFWLVYVVGSE